VASGEGFIWTISTSPRYEFELARVDPRTEEVTHFPLGVGDGDVGTPAGVGDVAVAAGSVWVTISPVNDGSYEVLRGTILRIEPSTGQVVARIPVGRNPVGIAEGEGAIWVANEADDSISRIDPTTNEEIATFPTVDGPRWLAYGFGSLWVQTEFGLPTVSRLDPATGHVTHVFEDVSDLSLGNDVVWVMDADGPRYVVHEIDPGTNVMTAHRLPSGGEPLFVVTGEGHTWLGAFFADEQATTPGLVIPGAFRPGRSEVFPVDPRTMEPLAEPVTACGDAGGSAVASDALWLMCQGDLLRVAAQN
jgi:YVTN family beta-propeller protein